MKERHHPARKLGVSIVVLLLALSHEARAQSALPASSSTQSASNAAEVGRPFITNYHPSEYGASVQNWAVLQDDRGVMYFGNNSGVLEYDGSSWRLIESPNRTTIRSLGSTPDGRIYAGAVGELGYLEADSTGQLQFVSLRDSVPEAYRDFADVWSTDVVGDEIYFNTAQYIFRWNGRSMRVVPAETSFHIAAAVEGTYYARQWDVGLMRLEGEEFRLVPGGEQFAQERIYVMLPFGDGRVLLGTRTGGFFLFDGDSITPFKTDADELLQRTGIYLPGAVLPGGRFAIGTFSEGVVIIDRAGRLVRHINRTAGLQDNVVLFTYADRDGSLWLGLDNGISQIEIDAPVSYYGAADGLTSNVLSLERHKGSLYVGTSIGLFRLDRTAREFRNIPGAGIQVFDLLSVDGDLLVASFDGLQLLEGDHTRFIKRSESGAFITNRLHRSRQHPELVFVSATRTGLTALRRVAPGRWIVEGTVPGTEYEFWSIAESEPGTLWLGTSAKGVVRVRFPETDEIPSLDAADVTAFGPEHGLPVSSVQIAAVGGRLLFLTKEGFFRFNPDSERFFADSSLFKGLRTGGDPEEWTVMEDEENRLWLNLGRESAVAFPQPDSTYRIDTAPFRRFAGNASAAIYPEAGGAVWLGFMNRLVRLDLTQKSGESANFPALVRRVVTTEGQQLYGGVGTAQRRDLPFSERALRFEYAAPRYVEAGRTEYQVMLKGFDLHPSAWTREAAKEYTNLPPGSYTFHVRARDVNGLESEDATYAFAILAPWYRTAWAYLLYALGAAALVLGFVQARTRQLEARSRDLEETVHERTIELEQRVEELAVINSVQEGLVAELDMQAIYDLVGERIRKLFDAQVVVIRTFDHEKRTTHIRYAVEKGERFYQEPQLADSFDQHLMGLREPLLVNEDFIGYIRRFAVEREALYGEAPRSALFVPMAVGEHVRGNVSLQNVDTEHAFDEGDVRLLATLTNSMSVALENARLFAEATRRATELDTVNRISRALVAQLDFDSLVALVGEQMRETFNADIVYVALLNREEQMIRFPYVYGDDLPPMALGEGLTSRIILTREPLLINQDVTRSYEELGLERIGKTPASYIGVPILVGGEAIGVISVQSTTEQDRFGANDLRLLSTIAANVGVALQNAEAYRDLEVALRELKSAQQQLVHQEKLASLGALTAGIAHEIKNPLNFVNNFAALNTELVDELTVALREDPAEAESILADLRLNTTKIEEHGRRADGIVRSMLEHSRGTKGERRTIKVNALVDEYVGLAYHGKRAQELDFEVNLEREYDDEAGEVEVVPQEIGRVLINLLGNAFDAVHEHAGKSNGSYEPKVRVVTQRAGNALQIRIEDNGPGIPAEIRNQIFEPFFTTKPSGSGTGLGLSMSHEIITQGHGGSLTVDSAENKGAAFIIVLPAIPAS